MKKYYDLIAERYQESNEYIAITKGLLFSFILEISRLYSGKNVSVSNTRQDELTDHSSFYSISITRKNGLFHFTPINYIYRISI